MMYRLYQQKFLLNCKSASSIMERLFFPNLFLYPNSHSLVGADLLAPSSVVRGAKKIRTAPFNITEGRPPPIGSLLPLSNRVCANRTASTTAESSLGCHRRQSFHSQIFTNKLLENSIIKLVIKGYVPAILTNLKEGRFMRSEGIVRAEGQIVPVGW